MDWLPVSAALLITGALALGAGAFLLPSSGGDASQTLRVVQDAGGRWLAAAVLLFLASVCLTLGLPAILALVQRRGWRWGLASGIALEVGLLGTAGVAMLIVLFRALVETDAIVDRNVDAVASEAGLATFLDVWIIGLYLGELLLAVALLRARTTPRWVPVALILHVATVPLGGLLPGYAAKATVLLLVAGFAGVAIEAAAPEARRGLS